MSAPPRLIGASIPPKAGGRRPPIHLARPHEPDPRGEQVPTWAAALIRLHGPEEGKKRVLEVARMIEQEKAAAPPTPPAEAAPPDPDARRVELVQRALHRLQLCLPPIVDKDEQLRNDFAELLGHEVNVRDSVIAAMMEWLAGEIERAAFSGTLSRVVEKEHTKIDSTPGSERELEMP